MAKSPQRFGGSFAPPIDSSKLSSYRSTISAIAPDSEFRHLKERLADLVKMIETFQQTPASSNPSTPHPSGRGTITMLEEAEMKRIFDVVPWEDEIKALQAECDKLPPGDLRNAAFHLIWFAIELTNDREPLTNDRL